MSPEQNPDQIPESIRHFLVTCIDSVEQLEVLSLLQEHPAREWSALSLSQELRSAEGSVEKRLRDLVSRKVLQPVESAFRYQAYSPEMNNTVAEALKYYRLHPYRVMDILFSKPMNAMQSFADAFRFKKEDS